MPQSTARFCPGKKFISVCSAVLAEGVFLVPTLLLCAAGSSVKDSLVPAGSMSAMLSAKKDYELVIVVSPKFGTATRCVCSTVLRPYK